MQRLFSSEQMPPSYGKTAEAILIHSPRSIELSSGEVASKLFIVDICDDMPGV